MRRSAADRTTRAPLIYVEYSLLPQSPTRDRITAHTHGRFTADKITKKPTKELNHRPQPRSMKFLRVNRSPFHSALRLLSCSAPTSKMFWWFYNIQHWLLATAWFALMSGWRALQSSPTSTLLSKILEIIFLKNDGSVCWHGGSEGSRSNFRAAQPRRHAYHVTFSEGATRDWSLLTAPVTTVRHTRRKYFSLFFFYFLAVESSSSTIFWKADGPAAAADGITFINPPPVILFR